MSKTTLHFNILNNYAIEEIYPELLYSPTHQINEWKYLAYFDLGQQFIDLAARTKNSEYISFTRLQETHVLSYLQQVDPGLGTLKLQSNGNWETTQAVNHKTYFQLAQQAFTLACGALNGPLAGMYNKALLDCLFVNSFGQLQENLGVLETMLGQIQQNGVTYSHYNPILENTLTTLKSVQNLEDLFDLPLQFLSEDISPLITINLTAEERSQAFAKLQHILTGRKQSSPAYHNIGWRARQIKILLETECHFQTDISLGIIGYPEPKFVKEIAKYKWNYHEARSPFDLPQDLNVITLWQLEDFSETLLLKSAYDKLQPQGLLLAAAPRSKCRPEQVRHQLESLTDSNWYFIDREGFSDILLAYTLKAEIFSPTLKVLISMVPYSVWTLGGYEMMLYKCREYFKTRGIHSDISLAGRLDPDLYDVVYVMGSTQENYKNQLLKASSTPKAFMPVSTLFFPNYLLAESIVREVQLKKTQGNSLANIIQFLNELPVPKLYQQILEQHASLLSNDKRILGNLAQICDYNLPLSMREQFELMPFIDFRKMEICMPALDKELFEQATPDLFHQTFPYRDFILCVGRIEANKNQLMLCAALRDTELPIVLIGNPDSQEYLDLCLTLGNQVYHLQGLSDELLASAYAAAKLLVCPSGSEGGPYVTIEAALAGCPVAVTVNAGQNEAFGHSFYHFEPFNLKNTKETILKAYYADNQGKIASARQKAQESFPNWKEMANQLMDVFFMLKLNAQGQPLIRYQNQWYHHVKGLVAPEKQFLPCLYEPLPDELEQLLDLPESQMKYFQTDYILTSSLSIAEQLKTRGFKNLITC